MTAPELPVWVELSSPQTGRPLVPAVERLARVIRDAATIVESTVHVPFHDLYAPHRAGLGYTVESESTNKRSAWALIGEWLVAASLGSDCAQRGLVATHCWFWQDANVALGTTADVRLDSVMMAGSNAIRALMPYLLDPMAAATRRDVLKTPSSREMRRVRKASGVYYTPGDIAHLMVRNLPHKIDAKQMRNWFDPAYGSGVFLRAILSAAGPENAGLRLYGVDLDPQAAEATSFVLTAEDLIQRPEGPPPWSRWHHFREDLATGDALLLDTSRLFDVEPSGNSEMSDVSSDAHGTEGRPLGTEGPWHLEKVFPEIQGRGFDRIVANPPYAPLRSTASAFIPALHTITGPSAAQDISPVFIELSTRLLASDGAMAIVTPLSVVSSTRAPFPALREHLIQQPGWLNLLSFDRAPDALFGDDIKTRNAIVQLDRGARSKKITVSPLYRWTSRNRHEALKSVPTVAVTELPNLASIVPKIGFEWEKTLYDACRAHNTTVSEWVVFRSQERLSDMAVPADYVRSTSIAIAPTAYNFLSVMREPLRAVMDGHDSTNKFSVMTLSSDLLAAAAFALMSSRVALWLWHITGDGFHVTSRVTHLVPCPGEHDRMVDRLAELGDALWKKAAQRSVVSRNGGRTTVAYPTWRYGDLLDAIDTECASMLHTTCVMELARWHDRLAVVYPEPKRKHLSRRTNA